MNERQPDDFRDDLDAEEQAALERELADLPAPEADPAFRARMRAEFLDGSIAAESDDASNARAARSPAPIPLRPERSASRTPRWILLAAAAVLIAVVLVFVNRGGPTLELHELRGDGIVTVDGVEIDTSDRATLARALVPGATVRVPAGVSLLTEFPEIALLESVAGTEFVLPEAYPSDGGAVRVDVRRGEVHFVSGPAFAGRTMEFSTPHGMVRITGTVVSIECGENFTCVCVLEGTALVGPDASTLEPVPEGDRMLFLEGKDPAISPAAEPHLHALEEFLERSGDAFRR